jgi:hypothetical protein
MTRIHSNSIMHLVNVLVGWLQTRYTHKLEHYVAHV